MRNNDDVLLKFLIIGDSSVNKEKLMSEIDDNKSYPPQSTIGVDFVIKKATLLGKKNVIAQIWNISGQERFRTIPSSYYGKVDAILLAYSATDRESFDGLLKWLQEIKRYAPNAPIVLLCTNISDINKNVVSKDEAQEFGGTLGFAGFFECHSRKDLDAACFLAMQAVLKNKQDLLEDIPKTEKIITSKYDIQTYLIMPCMMLFRGHFDPDSPLSKLPKEIITTSLSYFFFQMIVKRLMIIDIYAPHKHLNCGLINYLDSHNIFQAHWDAKIKERILREVSTTQLSVSCSNSGIVISLLEKNLSNLERDVIRNILGEFFTSYSAKKQCSIYKISNPKNIAEFLKNLGFSKKQSMDFCTQYSISENIVYQIYSEIVSFIKTL